MLKKKCALFLAIMMVATMLVGPLSVCAVDTTKVAPLSGNVSGLSANSTTGSEKYDTGVEAVTMEELKDRVDRKGNSIIEILQTIGIPVCVVGAIIGLFMVVFGAIGLVKGGVLTGFLAVLFAGVAAACIRYAPELVEFIIQFAAA